MKKPSFYWIYPACLLITYILWIGSMFFYDAWYVLYEYWLMSFTMIFGSFVAASTPAGGAAVAFPVFTKLLHVNLADARTFGLMIQSVGMTMASISKLA